MELSVSGNQQGRTRKPPLPYRKWSAATYHVILLSKDCV